MRRIVRRSSENDVANNYVSKDERNLWKQHPVMQEGSASQARRHAFQSLNRCAAIADRQLRVMKSGIKNVRVPRDAVIECGKRRRKHLYRRVTSLRGIVLGNKSSFSWRPESRLVR